MGRRMERGIWEGPQTIQRSISTKCVSNCLMHKCQITDNVTSTAMLSSYCKRLASLPSLHKIPQALKLLLNVS